jgi:hypothetical protein
MNFNFVKLTKNLLALLMTLCIISMPAMSASILLEGYDFSKIDGQTIYPTTYKINGYINGVQVFSDALCSYEQPCKIEVQSKSFLTICNSKRTTQCHTGIVIEPTASAIQRFGYVTILGTPYTIYRPEEMPVIDGFLAKQSELEKQRDEIKNSVFN